MMRLLVMTMTLWFTLPKSFDPLAYLPPQLIMKADEARWFVSTIVRKTAFRDTDAQGWVRLHWDILRKVMDHHTLAAIIDALEAGEVIEKSGSIRGVRSTGYKLLSRFSGDRHVQWQAVNAQLCARIQRHANQSLTLPKRLKPLHAALHAEQQHIAIRPEADAVIDQLPLHTRLCQDVLVGNIRRREFPFTVSTTGRIFNSITGMKRELRLSLTIDQQPVGNIDIRCAQPALLAVMLQKKSPSAELNDWDTLKHTLAEIPSLPLSLSPSELGSFAWLASKGELYDYLAEKTKLGRETLKRRFLVDVLAKRDPYPSDVEEAFRSAFPSVHSAIRAINRDDHAQLVRLLQRMESWLVIEVVAPRLLGKLPFVTLHDAIYCRAQDVPRVVGVFEEVFEELGFSLALKAEMEVAHEQAA